MLRFARSVIRGNVVDPVHLFLDACAIIYLLEGIAPFAVRVAAAMQGEANAGVGTSLAVSDLSLLECRAQPMRQGNVDLLARYDEFFSARSLLRVALLPPVIEIATLIRARDGLKTPDALQAASCLSLAGPARFVTGDEAFRRVEGLDVILL